jgi:hypothetical protein
MVQIEQDGHDDVCPVLRKRPYRLAER